jgi:hypothetical protein
MCVEYLLGYRVVHVDMGGAIDLPHPTFADLLFYTVFVIYEEPDEPVLPFLRNKRLPIKRTEEQMLFHLSLAAWALLHLSSLPKGHTVSYDEDSFMSIEATL